MHRWWGSSADSEKQNSERDQRAARRVIKSLDLNPNPLSDDEFVECNTSINNKSIFNVDGADDAESENSLYLSEDDEIPVMDAAAIAAQKALPFEDASYPDDDEAWKKELKLKFDKSDVKYWFNSVENQMRKYGINSQWSKKDAITLVLPEDVVEECKPILRLDQTEAGEHIYRDLKKEILKLYSPKDEDAYLQAAALKLDGKPSALGKKLIHKLCPGAKPFENCHCARIVYGMWVSKLSPAIKVQITDIKFDKDTYNQVFDKADKAFDSLGGNSTPAVVAAMSEPSPDSTGPSQSEVTQTSAVSNRGRGRGAFRGARGGRGRGTYRGGQNNQNQNRQTQNQNQPSSQKPHQKGQRHPDGPPDSACSRHWAAGRGATYCTDPLNCGWASIIAPRPPKNQNNQN